MKKMMVQRLSIFLLAMALLGPMTLMAQDEDDPGTGFEGGGSVEEPNAPIDGSIFWLAACGMSFAFFYFKSKGKRIES